MRLDPAVNRRKFAVEIDRLSQQRCVLESRGIFLLNSTTFPTVDLLFVPRNPLAFLTPVAQSGLIILPQPRLVKREIPSLSARSFKARFDLHDFDRRAPSLEFWDVWKNERCSFASMFRALEYEPERKAHAVLLDDHPVTRRPFLCIRGIREYHEHPQHTGDDWLLYRHEMSLFSIVMSVWRVTVDLSHPVLLPPQNGLQVDWQAEEKA